VLGEVKPPYVRSEKHGNTLYISGLTAVGTAANIKALLITALIHDRQYLFVVFNVRRIIKVSKKYESIT